MYSFVAVYQAVCPTVDFDSKLIKFSQACYMLPCVQSPRLRSAPSHRRLPQSPSSSTASSSVGDEEFETLDVDYLSSPRSAASVITSPRSAASIMSPTTSHATSPASWRSRSSYSKWIHITTINIAQFLNQKFLLKLFILVSGLVWYQHQNGQWLLKPHYHTYHTTHLTFITLKFNSKWCKNKQSQSRANSRTLAIAVSIMVVCVCDCLAFELTSLIAINPLIILIHRWTLQHCHVTQTVAADWLKCQRPSSLYSS